MNRLVKCLGLTTGDFFFPARLLVCAISPPGKGKEMAAMQTTASVIVATQPKLLLRQIQHSTRAYMPAAL